VVAVSRFKDFTEKTIANYDKQIADLNDQLKDAMEKKAKAEEAVQVKDTEIKKREVEEKKVAELKVARVDLLDKDQPKGEIYSIERTGAVVYVKLISTRNLPAQQTFSIRGVGMGGTILPDIKGKLVITEVLDDRLCQARITEVTDRDRDPIMRGDQLFTLGWNPYFVQHVALLGYMDMSGRPEAAQNNAEAMSRVNAFKAGVERQGMIVDAYYDLEKNEWKGKLSIQTDFLIVGDGVELKDAAAAGKEDNSPYGKIKKEAAELGVTVIPVRKFLALSGYRSVPVGTPDYGDSLHRSLEQAGSSLNRMRDKPKIGVELVPPAAGLPK
jgi:hypothetical protein